MNLSDLAPLSLLDGGTLSADDVAGRVVLFVNVASRCGLTPQYTGLVALSQSQPDVLVVGVPCNQFGGQEPGTAEEIQSFCSTTYGVDFPLLAKQDVNGADRSPLYGWLVGDGPDIRWNFAKFVVGRDGAVAARLSPTDTPDSDAVTAAIQAALG
jgi:glutathione peroxidase